MAIDRIYRVGIICLGRMGSTIDEGRHPDVPDSIASACTSCERLEVVAGSDPDSEKRAAFSAKWNVSALYSDYEEMLAKEELDLVAVCVPSGGLPKRVHTAPDADYRVDAHADMGMAVSEAKIPMLYLAEVIGTEGSIRVLNNGAGVQLRKGEWDEYAECPIESPPPNSSVKSCLEDIVDAHESGRATFNNIDVAHHTTEAVFAIAESHRRGGTWVELPLESRDLYIYHV